jgi:hypothetical protein
MGQNCFGYQSESGMIMQWFIKRQYIEKDKFVTEYWNRDSQSWQDKQGGKGYTERGASVMMQKLFKRHSFYTCLCLSAYRQTS